MQVTEATQMYLETILVLSKGGQGVRSVDIANHMGYSRPTISEQMKRLRESGLIEMDDNALITLTDEGLAIAQTMWERHNLLAQMLMAIGVSEQTAREDACRIEHDVSEETFECLKKHFQESPDAGKNML
ncbi:MAG: metal-dependent transcriptional regulator [Christensenellales bacterium]